MRNRAHTTKPMKDNVNKKVAVSHSGSLICSADAPSRSAERKTIADKLTKNDLITFAEDVAYVCISNESERLKNQNRLTDADIGVILDTIQESFMLARVAVEQRLLETLTTK